MQNTILLLLGLCLAIGITIASDTTKQHLSSNVMTQVGIVVSDIDAASRAYADVLGVEKPDIIITDSAEKTNIRYKEQSTDARAKLAFFNLENIQIELIEPIGGPSTWQEHLDTHGESVHHIAFKVGDMQQEIAMLEGKGLNMVQKGDFTGGSYAYIDGRDKLGVLLELLTSTDE